MAAKFLNSHVLFVLGVLPVWIARFNHNIRLCWSLWRRWSCRSLRGWWWVWRRARLWRLGTFAPLPSASTPRRHANSQRPRPKRQNCHTARLTLEDTVVACWSMDMVEVEALKSWRNEYEPWWKHRIASHPASWLYSRNSIDPWSLATFLCCYENSPRSFIQNLKNRVFVLISGRVTMVPVTKVSYQIMIPHHNKKVETDTLQINIMHNT